MTLYYNPKPPQSLGLRIDQGASGIDLSTVTGMRLDVSQPDKSTATWSVVIDTKTSTLIVAHHSFSLGEAAIAGKYYLVPVLLVPGGEIPCERIIQQFDDPFSRRTSS